MFAIFKNDVLVNFWENKIGDVFIMNTCSALGMNLSQVDLVHYDGLNSIPDYFDIDESKNITILERTVTTIPAVVDENGAIIESESETESFTAIESKTANPFFLKGTMIEPC